MRKLLQVIPRRDAKLADKVLGRRLQITIILLTRLVLGPTKVGIG
jgi:hypothetical protein